MASLLLRAAAGNKYPALLHPHGAKPHAHKFARCGAAADGGADELVSVLHLGRQSGLVAAAAGPVASNETSDVWGDFMDEIMGALQADPSSTVPGETADSGAAIPAEELLTAPSASDAANAGAGVVPDALLTGVDPSGAVAGDATTSGGGELLSALHLDASNPVVRFAGAAVSRMEELTAGLTETERWALLGLAAATWVYLTARPGVLSGAVDTYLLAPLQLALDSVLGRRSLKMSDFVVGERIGEGSFGVVYSGAVVPKNGAVEERVGKAKTRLDLDDRYKEKVILKKIKVGTFGAKECGDYEEWFNYRVARAAPESCADFLGSFVADQSKSEFVKGGKWLVWKFEEFCIALDYPMLTKRTILAAT